MIDKRALAEELTEAFINYQHRLDCPMPSATETKESIIRKYRTDYIFHTKVKSLVSGVMQPFVGLRADTMTDNDANEIRLVANEIMHRLYTGGHREQLELLRMYAVRAIEEINKANKHNTSREAR